jgi:hypothetical protein
MWTRLRGLRFSPNSASPSQTTDMSPATGSDLLSTAWRMVTPLPSPIPASLVLTYLAASRPPTSGALFTGWSWIDGTPSSNLACNSPGCSIFNGGEPKWVVTATFDVFASVFLAGIWPTDPSIPPIRMLTAVPRTTTLDSGPMAFTKYLAILPLQSVLGKPDRLRQ